MKFHLIKTLNGFKFAYDSDLEKGKKVKVGDIVECEIKQPRNYNFHKKFFALIELVFQNQEITDDKEDLRAYLIMKAGFYKTVQTKEGVMYLPKSISFANMDEIEFHELYGKLLNVACNLLDLDEKTIIEEIAEFY